MDGWRELCKRGDADGEQEWRLGVGRTGVKGWKFGGGGHFWDFPETWDRESHIKSLGVTLAETLAAGYMKPEVTTSYSQAGFPVEDKDSNPLNIFDLKFVLPIRCAGTKMEQRLREWSTKTGPT